MPQFKQPIPLQELAFGCVVRCTVHYCDALSVKGSLTEFREGIANIKQYVSDRLPCILFMEFCKKFLAVFNFIRWIRPDSHNSVVIELIMDVQFVGLTCGDNILRYVNACDVHRIRGLQVLDWTQLQFQSPVPYSGLGNYRLQDLKTFICPTTCTDWYLEIIGSRCLKLEVLRIQESRNVTDRGLRALSPCSELRIIDINDCQVSDDGVNGLLNVHEQLEEFNVNQYFTIVETSFDLLSRPITSVCPSMKRFSLKTDPVTNAHLHSVVTLFPNLNYLQFCGTFTDDFFLLQGLKNLTKLDFGYARRFSMKNLKDLLKIIGVNITELMLRKNFYVTQNDLNFLSTACGNIELMYFSYRATQPTEKMIVPPFYNLKYLECLQYGRYSIELEFCEMLKLESVMIRGFHDIFSTIESMMLDNIKFPNLREVRTSHHYDGAIDRINQIAKNNNLDFNVRFSKCHH